MRIGIVLTPISDHHLRLASQVGVSDVVIRYPGLEYSDLADRKAGIESFGLRVSVIEGYLPIEDIKLGGPRRDAEIEQMKTLVRNMGRAGIGLLCYNFIAGGDWARTSVDEKGRGGALVTGFDLSALPRPRPRRRTCLRPTASGRTWTFFWRESCPWPRSAGSRWPCTRTIPPFPTSRAIPAL